MVSNIVSVVVFIWIAILINWYFLVTNGCLSFCDEEPPDLLRARWVIILDTGHQITSHPTDSKLVRAANWSLTFHFAPFTCADILKGCNFCIYAKFAPCVSVNLLRVHMVLNKFRIKWKWLSKFNNGGLFSNNEKEDFPLQNVLCSSKFLGCARSIEGVVESKYG